MTSVQVAWGPNAEAQRNASVEARVQWQPIGSAIDLDLDRIEARKARSEFDDFLGKLASGERQAAVQSERRVQRRSFLASWEGALRYQQLLLDSAAIVLPYKQIQRTDEAWEFLLSQPAPDNLGWPEGSPLVVEVGQRQRVPVGTLIYSAGDRVLVDPSVFIRGQAQELPSSAGLALDLGAQQESLQRQQRALDVLQSGGGASPRLLEVLLDVRRAEFDDVDARIEFFHKDLGEDKRRAVQRALAARDLFILQGPPGTGKTTVISEIVLQILAAKPDARILLSSQSNVAVNHALSRIAELRADTPLEIVRLGRGEKIGHGAEAWRLDQRLEQWREVVIARCERVLSELDEESKHFRAERDKARPPRDQREELSLCREWIDEATGLLASLQDDVEKHSALFVALETARSRGSEPNIGMQAELEALNESIADQRGRIASHIESVRALLPPDARGEPLGEIAQEIDRLRTVVVTLLDPGTADDPTRDARALVRDWCEVFGRTDDFRVPLLQRANILAATCLFVGNRVLRGSDFDWAVIDEAGRATAPELLIPLVRARRVVLVGDERQLPPMLDEELSPSKLASAGVDADGLETSLFENLVNEASRVSPNMVQMLTIQHRMHPSIGRLVSQVFYRGQLQQGVKDEDRVHGLSWIPRPVTWYSTSGLPRREETRRGKSFANQVEVEEIEKLLNRMEADYRAMGERREVGVIAGYSAQIEALVGRLEPNDATRWMALEIEIATVDAFQGRDRDLVVYSTVRSNRDGHLGFLADRRRLNVAFSRGRQLLLIVGDAVMLERSSSRDNPFGSVIRHIRAESNDCAMESLYRGDA